MKKTGLFIFLLSLLLISKTIGQVVLSEIMFNPEGTERYNEFVEIINISATDSVDLSGWSIGDSLKQSEIVPHQEGIVISPGQHAIILSPNYFTNSNQYDSLIPDSALVLTIATSQFGSYGFANDRGEPVTLMDSSGTIQSKWTYRVPGEDGFSEEKKLPDRGDISTNWGKSLQPNGTPGFQNSITPKPYDLALDTVIVTPQIPSRKDSVLITTTLINLGSQPVYEAQLLIIDVTESVPVVLAQRELNFSGLEWLDTATISITLPPFQPGLQKIGIEVVFDRDQNPDNNQSVIDLAILPAERDVVISEVYFYPSSDEPRWIEIHNTANFTVDLTGWMLLINSEPLIWADANRPQIGPDERIIVTEAIDGGLFFWPTKSIQVESNLPQLPAIETTKLVYGESVLDSVSLKRLTPKEGVSFERNETTDQHQWGLCPHAAGNTFGEANALGRSFFDLSFCRENPLTAKNRIAGEMTSIQVCVSNMGNNVSKPFDLNIKLADNDSLVYATSESATIYPQQSNIVAADMIFPNPGLYRLLLRLQSEGDAYANNDTLQVELIVGYPPCAVVINEIMYHTDERDQEWIELFNPGPRAIDLAGWSVGDSRKRSIITDVSFLFNPGEFLILAHNPVTLHSGQIFLNLPELNNGGDQVILRDFAYNVIDSLAYEQEWGGGRMVSLERIRFEETSTKPVNWATCLDSAGHTAGRKNSVSPGHYDVAIDTASISMYPEKPSEGTDAELAFQIENIGRAPLAGCVAHINIFPLADSARPVAADSLTVDHLDIFENKTIRWNWQNVPGGIFILLLTVENPLDERLANNVTQKRLVIGYQRGCAVINEFMYRPLPDREDWIELYNPGTEPVELAGWSVANADSESIVSLPYKSRLLRPNQFAVMSGDSVFLGEMDVSQRILLQKFPNFRSDGDDVVLYDAVGGIVDRVSYSPEWGDLRGRSLERISPNVDSNEKTNWAQNVSALGHSAGSENSVYTRILPDQAALAVSPNPFSPNNDGFDDVAAITITLPTTYARVNLKIFDIRGRLVRFLLNNEFSGSSRTVFWDGRNDEGRPARIGPYIVYLEAVDEGDRTIMNARKTLVLAAPL